VGEAIRRVGRSPRLATVFVTKAPQVLLNLTAPDLLPSVLAPRLSATSKLQRNSSTGLEFWQYLTSESLAPPHLPSRVNNRQPRSFRPQHIPNCAYVHCISPVITPTVLLPLFPVSSDTTLLPVGSHSFTFTTSLTTSIDSHLGRNTSKKPSQSSSWRSFAVALSVPLTSTGTSPTWSSSSCLSLFCPAMLWPGSTLTST